MVALNFPNSPAVNQLFPSPAIPGIPTWIWDGQKWRLLTGGAGGGVELASAAELRAMTSGRVVGTDGLKGALAIRDFGVAASALEPNFLQFVNAQWTINDNISLQFPTDDLTPVVGRSGLLAFSMGWPGTISYATGYTFNEMEVPDIITTAGGFNLFSYSIWKVDRINLALIGAGVL